MQPATLAVILARGLGTRMRRESQDGSADGTGDGRMDTAGTHDLTAPQVRAAEAGLKGLMPVGRPLLDYVLSALADAGITRAVLVIGPEHGVIRDYVATLAPRSRVRVAFATQVEPKGTADAVLAAREAVGAAASFLVLNSDNYYPAAQIRLAAALAGNGLVAFDADALVRESGIEPERVLSYAFVEFDEQGWLTAILEKPSPTAAVALRAERWVSMNLWSFTPRIFEACGRVRASERGEVELQSAVTIAMRELGERFRVVTARAGVLDLSSRADIATVTERLSQIEPRP